MIGTNYVIILSIVVVAVCAIFLDGLFEPSKNKKVEEEIDLIGQDCMELFWLRKLRKKSKALEEEFGYRVVLTKTDSIPSLTEYKILNEKDDVINSIKGEYSEKMLIDFLEMIDEILSGDING